MPRRLAEKLEHVGDIRWVEPPQPLPVLAQAMTWSPLHADHPGHLWLRGVVAEVASEL